MNLTRLLRPYFGRLYRKELRAGENVAASQQQLLRRLTAQGARTAYGQQAGIGGPQDYARFSRRVPPAQYSRLRPFVMEAVAGKADVLWPGRVHRFAQSSGTSDGKSKYIPVTQHNLRHGHYAGAAFSLASYLHHHPESRILSGKNLILGGSYANELTLPKGVKVGDLSATLIDCINPLVNLVRVPEKRIALMEDWKEKLPAIAGAAAREDVRSLSGVPSWFLTVLRTVVENRGAEHMHDIWPNLEVFFHGGIAFGPYREQYARLMGGRDINYWENYNASEGFFGVQAAPGSDAMRLLMGTEVFYEFGPAEGTDKPDCLIPAWEVKAGETYSLYVTSSNGLWRFAVGDTVRVESTAPLTITIAGRTHHYINAFGEEVMVYNTDRALQKACAATGAEATDYTAAPVFAMGNKRGRHQWMIEFAKLPDSPERFAAELDKALQEENSDYQAKRQGGIFLDPLTVEVAREGLFDEWLAQTGKLGGQRKVPRLSNDRRIMDRLIEINGKRQ